MRVVYDVNNLQIIQVTDDDSSITSFPSNCGVIQGDSITIATIGTTLGIDLSQITNLDMTNNELKVLKDMAFGRSVVLRYLTENMEITIDTQSNIDQLNTFLSVKLLLESGAIITARDVLTTLSDDMFVVTPEYQTSTERKQSYIDQINSYINN